MLSEGFPHYTTRMTKARIDALSLLLVCVASSGWTQTGTSWLRVAFKPEVTAEQRSRLAQDGASGGWLKTAEPSIGAAARWDCSAQALQILRADPRILSVEVEALEPTASASADALPKDGARGAIDLSDIPAERLFDGAAVRLGNLSDPVDGTLGATAIGATLAPAPALTLAAKAEVFEGRAQAIMNPWGLLGQSNDIPIWTGTYIAAEANRFKATHDPEALKNMERSLWGFHTLHEIAGSRGVIARNIRVALPEDAKRKLPYDQHLGMGKYAGLLWTGGPSWDQMTGYLFGVSESWGQIQDPALKAALSSDLRAVAHNFMSNKGKLLSEDTHLDSSPHYYYQDRIPKALQILTTPLRLVLPARGGGPMSGLELVKVAAAVTGDADIEAYYHRLIDKEKFAWYTEHKTAGATEAFIKKHGKLINFIAHRLYGKDVKATADSLRSPVGTNLEHLEFYDLLSNESDPKLRAAYAAGFRAAHEPVASHGNTFWNFLEASQLGDDAGVKDGLDSLQRLPLDYGTRKNSADPSIPKYKGLGSNFFQRKPHWEWFAEQPLPFDKRPMHTFLWQNNAMAMDGDFGYKDADGAAYLVAYWFGRSHGYIAPAQ